MTEPTTPTPSAAVAHRATGALAVQPDQQFWSEEQHAALQQLGLGDASNGDLAVFLTFAQRTGLDPWARQLYMIGRYDRDTGRQKYTIQASIDGLRIVAQRSGVYRGQIGPEWCGPDGRWMDVWLEEDPPAAARVGVLRADFAAPQYAVALYREYVSTKRDGKPTSMWASKPALMIAKCAEALALRKAFPQDLSGVYSDDEMPTVIEGEVVAPQAEQRPPARPAQQRNAPVVHPELVPDAVRNAVLDATSRPDMVERLIAAGAVIRQPSGDPSWERASELKELRVPNQHGEEVSAWELIATAAGSLPAEEPTPPADEDDADPDHDADVADDTVQGTIDTEDVQ